jgi:type IV secretion system protein VirB6
MDFKPFSTLYTFYDDAIVHVISEGTANIIHLISPLLAAGFGIYMLLTMFAHLRGTTDEPLIDFFYQMIGWGAVIVFGLNIETYQLYVAPFVLGLGDDLAGALSPSFQPASALDGMLVSFSEAFGKIWNEANTIPQSLFAVVAIALLGLAASAFMLISIFYLILAKLALGVLVAIGPIFIASALFPPTRELFKNWTGQVLNYAFLVMLFAFIARIQIELMQTIIPSEFTIASLFGTFIVSVFFVLVSLNLPGIAAALAGGIGIATMARKIPMPTRLPRIFGGKEGGKAKPG